MNVINGQLTFRDVLTKQKPLASKPVQSARLTGNQWCAGELLDILRLIPGNPRLMIHDLGPFDKSPENTIVLPSRGSRVQEIIGLLESLSYGTEVRVRDYTRVSPTGDEIFGLWHKKPEFERCYCGDPNVERVRLVKGRQPEGKNLIVCFIDRR